MRVGVSGAYPVPIERFARKSVFFVDTATPQFDITGLASVDTRPPLLQLRGASNAYVVEPTLADPMLRLATNDGETAITRMSDLLTASPAWADEASPRWAVNWASVRFTDAPPSQRQPIDYRQDDVSPPGFDEKSLPIVPGLESEVSTRQNAAPGVRSALRSGENREEL